MYSMLIKFPDQLVPDTNAINAYYEGVKDGVKVFAKWQAGKLYVGSLMLPLNQVLWQLESERKQVIEALENLGEVPSRMRGAAQ
jgi:hypothetical protein